MLLVAVALVVALPQGPAAAQAGPECVPPPLEVRIADVTRQPDGTGESLVLHVDDRNPAEFVSGYNVYRTDGIFGCDFGKALVAQTAGTTFGDTGLKNGHPYSYTVLPIGSGGPSCFGPASNCGAVGSADIFADGFESGSINAWDANAQ